MDNGLSMMIIIIIITQKFKLKASNFIFCFFNLMKIFQSNILHKSPYYHDKPFIRKFQTVEIWTIFLPMIEKQQN